VEQAALHGLSAGAWRRYSDPGFKHYETKSLGYKFNMTDVQAALGIHQLPHVDEWIDRRADCWAQYDAALADLPLDLPPAPDPDTRHARHLYQVRITDDAPISRDDLLHALHANRIGAGSTTAQFTCSRTTAIGMGLTLRRCPSPRTSPRGP
jgi:dTDP-4-amino-4,6-dideoxygalactose transaminase